MYERNKVLHLLPGDRASVLSACLLIEQGYDVQMITFDNGHMSDVDCVDEVASWIMDTYPEGTAHYMLSNNIAMTMHEYMNTAWQKQVSDLAVPYPELNISRAHCLACKTASYVHAIACCKAHGIKYLSDGMQRSDGSFHKSDAMRARLEKLCKDNGITLLTPIYDLSSDRNMARQLADRGFALNTVEPQCYLKCAERAQLGEREVRDLSKYFDLELLPALKIEIAVLTKSKQYIVQTDWRDKVDWD